MAASTKSPCDCGVSPAGGTPEEFGEFVGAEVEKWHQAVQTANLKAE